MNTQEELEQHHIKETKKHILRVQHFLSLVIKELEKRGEAHDQSKLQSPEVEVFAKETPHIKGLQFGTQEYEDCKKRMVVALDHHYANNSHHPEYYCSEEMSGMCLIDLIEMFCDWRAATERHKNGDIKKSIEIQGEKYQIPEMLKRMMHNTVSFFE
jgi:hypothetical protein